MGSFQVNAKYHGKGQGGLHALFSAEQSSAKKRVAKYLFKKNYTVREKWWPLLSCYWQSWQTRFHAQQVEWLRRAISILSILFFPGNATVRYILKKHYNLKRRIGGSNTSDTSNQLIVLRKSSCTCRLGQVIPARHYRSLNQYLCNIWGPFTDIVHCDSIYISRHDE